MNVRVVFFYFTYMRRMLPYSLSSALMSAVSGIVVTRTGSYRPTMWFGWFVMTLGWGLMIMLDSTSTKYVHIHCRSRVITTILLNSAEKEVYPFIAALGIGCLFQVSLLHHHQRSALTIAFVTDPAHCHTSGHAYQGHGYQHRCFYVPPVSMILPCAFHRYLLVFRTLGGTVGITIGEAIISSVLQQKLRGIQGLTIDTSAAALNDSVRQISSISVRNNFMILVLACSPVLPEPNSAW
jgi:hypothetical protein